MGVRGPIGGTECPRVYVNVARAVQTSFEGLVALAVNRSDPAVFVVSTRASKEPLGAFVTRVSLSLIHI